MVYEDEKEEDFTDDNELGSRFIFEDMSLERVHGRLKAMEEIMRGMYIQLCSKIDELAHEKDK